MGPGFGPTARHVWFAAKEVSNLKENGVIDFDPDELAYPQPLSQAPAGDYQAMALLDERHIYSYDPYSGIPGGTLHTPVVQIEHLNPADTSPVELTLQERAAVAPAPPLPPSTEVVDFLSPALSHFWGRPVHMRGYVLLPPDYNSHPRLRYPTVYITQGFGGTMDNVAKYVVPRYQQFFQEKKLPPMIYVFLDQSCPEGMHEFADSVNNGPWGKALTEELIPHLESKYRMNARSSGRFLTGHSSGGWTSLWLMVRYPKFFGGSWATSPDPPDFRNFVGANLRADPPVNFYHHKDGSPRMLVRMDGKEVMTLEDFVRQERVLGDYGGQFASFEWVFSPRGDDGRPQQLFDRDTGVIDAKVAKAWERYDIAELLRQQASMLRPLLQGKIHVIVGTADEFHLDEPVRLLESTMKELNIPTDFEYLEGRTHFNLYEGGLEEKIATQIQQVAKPTAAISKPH
ncbi:MAG TPA: alpha/beta hydrolase [Candidatus Angelobacter sp.]|nr:alpha/beta hydrolase [Candidatus Angelobacter sp.]